MVEEEKTYQFLMGLNDDSFSTIYSQVLALSPVPSLDTIFNIISHEENHKWMMLERDHRTESILVFTAKEQASMIENPMCKHCRHYNMMKQIVMKSLDIRKAGIIEEETMDAKGVEETPEEAGEEPTLAACSLGVNWLSLPRLRPR